MSNEVENLVNAIGAVAELTKQFYDRLKDAGFEKEDALYLTGKFIDGLGIGGDK